MAKCKLSKRKKRKIKQGTKVQFTWHGSKEIYIGRIEVCKRGHFYFIDESCFTCNKLDHHQEGLRYYNRLNSFVPFTSFKIITDDQGNI